METGIILYMMGCDAGDVKFDLDKTLAQMKERSDNVQLVEAATNCIDMMDAWNQLMDKGVDRVILMIGQMVSDSKVILSGREIRMSEFDVSAFSNGKSIH